MSGKVYLEEAKTSGNGGLTPLYTPVQPIVIHRDLKCENVLIEEHNVCKVCDFGESRTMDEVTMTCVGTPYYIAPEVFRGEHYDESADVFSFAIIMCAVANNGDLSGFFKGAFERGGVNSDASVTGMVIPNKFAMGWRPTFPPEWNEKLPVLTKLISLCWHAAHAHRPSMSELHLELDEFWKHNAIITEGMKGGAQGDGAANLFSNKEADSGFAEYEEYKDTPKGTIVAMLVNAKDELNELKIENRKMAALVPNDTVSEINSFAKKAVHDSNARRRSSLMQSSMYSSMYDIGSSDSKNGIDAKVMSLQRKPADANF